jgi:hypothetical protein
MGLQFVRVAVLSVCRSPARLNASSRQAAGVNVAGDPSKIGVSQSERPSRALQHALVSLGTLAKRGANPHVARCGGCVAVDGAYA